MNCVWRRPSDAARASSAGPQRSVMRDGKPRARITLLDEGEGAQRTPGIILGGESAIVQEMGTGARRFR